MKIQNSVFTFLSLFAFGGSGDFLSPEEKSIKNEQIMRNEPNFQKSQMFITATVTMNCSGKMKMDTWSKRTQTNPISNRRQFYFLLDTEQKEVILLDCFFFRV
jgi:hypothetical protein